MTDNSVAIECTFRLCVCILTGFMPLSQYFIYSNFHYRQASNFGGLGAV